MTYEEAVNQLEQLVQDLEHTEALSMDEYRKKALEGKKMLEICRQKLKDWEHEL